MKYILISLLSFTPSIYCANLVKEETVKIDKITLTISKIEFDGHTYIHFKNPWSYSANKILHDPSCECLKSENPTASESDP